MRLSWFYLRHSPGNEHSFHTTILQQNNVHAHEVHTSNYSQVTGSLISSTSGENLEKSRGKGSVPNTKVEKTEVLGGEF